jgi:hypothetical protein
MYATVRSYSAGSALVDALVENEDEIRQVVSRIDGFRAYYLIRTSDGEALSVSIYDDEAGAEQSTSAAADWVRENLADLSVSPPQVTSGEVAVSF